MKNQELVKQEETESQALALFQGIDDDGFESQEVEFFSTEGMEGVELKAVLLQKLEMQVQGELKPFIKGYLQTEKGAKLVYFGQHQIRTTFDRMNAGNGVQAKITFLGKEPLPKSGGKTLNKFSIFAKSI